MIEQVLAVSKKVKPRSSFTVLAHLMEEAGELSTELLVRHGKSQKSPGDDGVIGEAIDVVLCAIDIIYVEYPLLEAEDIMEIVRRKLKKWKDKNS
jgi:NTP pyrophosphatase (non-canonical NTP hydrolase)